MRRSDVRRALARADAIAAIITIPRARINLAEAKA